MLIELAILNAAGDKRLTWDPADPGQVDAARQEVAELKSRGYSFFLVNPYTLQPGMTSLPDFVEMGQGALDVRRISAEELVGTPPSDWRPFDETRPEETKQRRGRRSNAENPTAQALAVPRQAGG